MTLADATQLCTRAIQNSDTIKQCVTRVGLSFDSEIEACVEDIKVCVQGLTYLRHNQTVNILSRIDIKC